MGPYACTVDALPNESFFQAEAEVNSLCKTIPASRLGTNWEFRRQSMYCPYSIKYYLASDASQTLGYFP